MRLCASWPRNSITAVQKMTAIYFEKEHGQGNYYNEEGRSLARSFLRFPLEFSAITSHFTESRFHPLLKTNLPRTGVDFAAQRGTPVRAVGDRIITEAGWNGGYGKAIDVVQIRHLHESLCPFGPVRRRHSARDRRNQRPSYKSCRGSTGRSTGAAFAFRIVQRPTSGNPLSVDFPGNESIGPGLQKVFETQMRTYWYG